MTVYTLEALRDGVLVDRRVCHNYYDSDSETLERRKFMADLRHRLGVSADDLVIVRVVRDPVDDLPRPTPRRFMPPADKYQKLLEATTDGNAPDGWICVLCCWSFALRDENKKCPLCGRTTLLYQPDRLERP